MMPLPVLDSHMPPVRVMALHALAYCQRLFYLEEVEELRVADHRVFAGRQLQATLEADEDGDAVSLELVSESIGIVGKVDCVRRRDGSHVMTCMMTKDSVSARSTWRATATVLNTLYFDAG